MAENIQSQVIPETPAEYLSGLVRQLLLEQSVAKSNGCQTIEIYFRDGQPVDIELIDRKKYRFLVPCVHCRKPFDSSKLQKCPNCDKPRTAKRGEASELNRAG